MSDAWERLCESVGETPETVLPDYTAKCTIDGEHVQMVDMKITLPRPRKPDPPAYLRKPNRTRWRGIIRAALGRKWARSWRYTMTKSLGRDWPHLGYIEHLRRQHEIIQHGNLCDMFDWLHGKPGYQWIGVNGWDGEPAAENRWVREDGSDALLEPTVPWEHARGELGPDGEDGSGE